mmetsp:Transcript_5866/g.9478  ORF Transcript_5866/g.9478 Transcript_5866/m.9478 type:complete len:176 (-) Transcript_5866:1381-1908(-)
MTLIKWIETLHSITNVNILKCVPRFLEKLFLIVESQNNEKQQVKTEVGKKSLEQLRLFLDDLKEPSSRTLDLDKEILIELTKFLKEQKGSSSGKGLYEALLWLEDFIGYFELDYKTMLEDNKDLLSSPEEKLSSEEKEIIKQQKDFMDQIFKIQFPDIIEIILLYTPRPNCGNLV